VLGRTLAHSLRSSLAQRHRQHGRPGRRDAPGALARTVAALGAVAVARSARAHRRTRCSGRGGASTGEARAVRLTRRRWRGLTRAARQRGGVEEVAQRRHSRWWRRSGSRRRWARGPATPVNQGRGPNDGSELRGTTHWDGAEMVAVASNPVALAVLRSASSDLR
jgi:hypothetical protein